MKFRSAKMALCAALFLVAATKTQAAPRADILKANGGDIRITPLFHASLMLEYGGKVIYVDPVSAAPLPKKADVILITHPHGDHLDLAATAKLKKPKTLIIAPESVATQIRAVKGNAVYPMSQGSFVRFNAPLHSDQVAFAIPHFSVQAVPAYNLVRGPKPGAKYHPRANNWNGYILTLGGRRIYIAGDTEATPEMKALKNIDVAFIPMNLPYTMTPQEAAASVDAFKPRIVYPYHYRYPFDKTNNNPQQFAAALKNKNIKVRLREWYPSEAVQRALKK